MSGQPCGTVRRDVLERALVEFEEDLQRGADARCLDLAPKPALVAAHAVHDARDVAEVLLELFFQDLPIIKHGMRLSGEYMLTSALGPRKRVVSSNLPTFWAMEITLLSFSRVYWSLSCVPVPQ